jgi:uncharacterized protein (TIGR02246 family)
VSDWHEIERIKQLKARYFRTMDTKDWDAYRAVFADDVVMDTSEAGGNVVEGADAFLEFLVPTLSGTVTVHQGHMPEIELTGDSSATGVWALQDTIWWPNGTVMHGYGHYHESYEKVGGEWKIKSSKLTRLKVVFTEASQ